MRCGCVGAGLGSAVGASAPLLLTPPTSDNDINWKPKTFNRLDILSESDGKPIECLRQNQLWVDHGQIARAPE